MDGPYPVPNPPSIKGKRRGGPDSNPPVALSGVLLASAVISWKTTINIIRSGNEVFMKVGATRHVLNLNHHWPSDFWNAQVPHGMQSTFCFVTVVMEEHDLT